MIGTTIAIRGTRREMRAAIRDLPAIMSGRKPDVHGLGRLFKSHFAFHWFEKVHEAYLIKSLGGTDDAGISWPPISRETIARRPMNPGDARRIRGKGASPISERTRGLLTPAQDALWRGIFKSNYLKLLSRTDPMTAKATAAKIAWGILKSKGAQTKKEVLGNRKLPIGRDTDRLLEACAPGTVMGSTYQPPKDQKVAYHHGAMDFKIKVPYAQHFHKRRRIWPAASNSGTWSKYAARKALTALVQQIKRQKGLK